MTLRERRTQVFSASDDFLNSAFEKLLSGTRPQRHATVYFFITVHLVVFKNLYFVIMYA